MHVVPGMVEAQPRPYAARADGHAELKAQPLVADEMEQEGDPVPPAKPLVVLDKAEAAHVTVEEPPLVPEQAVLEAGPAVPARTVLAQALVEVGPAAFTVVTS